MSLTNLTMSIGSDNFKKMITEYDVFVDKSLFIKGIIDSGEEAILLTKARRWGKTLNMDMLKTFLSIEIDQEGNIKTDNPNKVLFTGGSINLESKGEKNIERLKIAEIDNGKYMKYQGHYPVIFISFKDVIGSSYSEIESKLKTEIIKLYRSHEYLKHSNKLSSYVKVDLEKYLQGNINKVEIKGSLHLLSELLSKHHHKRVYILVDEYDKPVNHLLEGGTTKNESDLITQTAELITNIFSECGKGNPYLEKIIITGIFDTLKKEGGSGFNNVKVHGMADPEFSTSFGFSGREVNDLVTKLTFGSQENLVKQNIKDWYDGYSVPLYNGTYIDVYIPWAVVNYLNDASKGEIEPTNYWSRSGASIILQGLLKSLMDKQLAEKFRLLAEGKEQAFQFDKLTSLLEHDLYSYKKAEELFSYLLLNSGYLTAKKERGNYLFKVPNFEVKKEFARVIEKEL